VGVTSEFALREEGSTEPPDGGIEPVKKASEVGQGCHPEVASLNVTEFMEEGHAESFGGPILGVFWQIDGGAENARDDRGVQLRVKV